MPREIINVQVKTAIYLYTVQSFLMTNITAGWSGQCGHAARVFTVIRHYAIVIGWKPGWGKVLEDVAGGTRTG